MKKELYGDVLFFETVEINGEKKIKTTSENEVRRIVDARGTQNIEYEIVTNTIDYTDEAYVEILAQMKKIKEIEKEVKEGKKENSGKKYVSVSYAGFDRNYWFSEILRDRFEQILNEQRILRLKIKDRNINTRNSAIAICAAFALLATGILIGLQKNKNPFNGQSTSISSSSISNTPTTSGIEKPTFKFDINNEKERKEQVEKLAIELRNKQKYNADLAVLEDALSIINGRYPFEGITVAEASEKTRQAKNLIANVLTNNQNGDVEMVALSNYIADSETAELAKETETVVRNIAVQYTKEKAAYDGKREDVNIPLSEDYNKKKITLISYINNVFSDVDYIEETAGAQLLNSMILTQAAAEYVEPTDSIVENDKRGQEATWPYDFYKLDVVENNESKTIIYNPIVSPEKKLYVVEGQENSKKYTEEYLINIGAIHMGIGANLSDNLKLANANVYATYKVCTDYESYLSNSTSKSK